MTGESIAFTCTADGMSRPDIKWRKDGQLIFNTTRLNILSQKDILRLQSLPGIQQISSSLTLSDLRLITHAELTMKQNYLYH